MFDIARATGHPEAHEERGHMAKQTALKALQMATCDNAKLLPLSGKLNPYPEGALGVIDEGA